MQCSTCAFSPISSTICPSLDAKSLAYYGRKRREGKHYAQAVIALARQRTNVLWTMLTHDKPYNPDHRAA